MAKKSLKKMTVLTEGCYPMYTGTSMSLVKALEEVGEYRTSLIDRRKIAVVNGMSLYVGTASQNRALLDLLKKGELKKPKW